MSLANGRFIKHLWAVNQGAHFPPHQPKQMAETVEL